MLRFIDQEDPTPAQEPEPQATFDTSAMEVTMEDEAGLKPLPTDRMLRQAGRLMRTPPPRDPALHDLTIKRIQRVNKATENWNPLEAELKQQFNNINPNPRSRLGAPTWESFDQSLQPLIHRLGAEMRGARMEDAMEQYRITKGKPNYAPGNLERDNDLSDLVDDHMALEIRQQLFRFLDEKSAKSGLNEMQMWQLPGTMQGRLRKLGNDTLYEWNTRRKHQLRENTLDMLQITRDAVRGI
jgi:hypothetical protein